MRKAALICAVLWPLLWWPTLVQSQPNTQNVMGSDPPSVDAKYDIRDSSAKRQRVI